MTKDVIEKLRELCNDKESCRIIDTFENQLSETRCSIAVLGEFNRGKSSLINLLFGKDILPVDIVPTTPTVISIAYGEVSSVVLHEADGSNCTTTLSEQTLSRLHTSESGGSGSSGLRLVQITTPEAPERLIIFDTPGVNDLGETDPGLVYTILPWVDLAMVVMDASAGMSNSERVFVKNQLTHAVRPTLFFVINKMDRLSLDDESEVEEVKQEFINSINEIVVDKSTIVFGVSRAGHAFAETTRKDILQALDGVLSTALKGRRERLYRSTALQLEPIRDQLRTQAQTSSKAASMMMLRLQGVISAIDESFVIFSKHCIDSGKLPLSKMIDRSIDHLQERLVSDLERKIAMSGGSIIAYAEHGLTYDITLGIQNWVDGHVREVHSYLKRHRLFVASEFERNFGTAFPLNRAENLIFTLARCETEAIDVSGYANQERALTLMRFGLPAAGSLILGIVASPLAVIGLASGLLIADAKRKQSEEESRIALKHVARTLIDQAITKIRYDLSLQVEQHFKSFNEQLQEAYSNRRSSSQAALKEASIRTGNDNIEIMAKIEQLTSAIKLLNGD